MLQFYSHRGLVDAVVIEGRRGDGRRGGVAASIGGEGGQLQVKNAGAGWRALREDAAASSSCPQSRPGGPPPPHALTSLAQTGFFYVQDVCAVGAGCLESLDVKFKFN